jgi:U1 small nuclear ribonucleoprotein 70kDa
MTGSNREPVRPRDGSGYMDRDKPRESGGYGGRDDYGGRKRYHDGDNSDDPRTKRRY